MMLSSLPVEPGSSDAFVVTPSSNPKTNEQQWAAKFAHLAIPLLSAAPSFCSSSCYRKIGFDPYAS
jgi:hypothetical protein